MTDIDPQADIELHSGAEHVTVRVPLAGTVTGEWLRCYRQLAQAAKDKGTRAGTSDKSASVRYVKILAARAITSPRIMRAGKVAACPARLLEAQEP